MRTIQRSQILPVFLTSCCLKKEEFRARTIAAIRRWCDRFKRISGFIVMPGIFPTSPALAASLCQ